MAYVKIDDFLCEHCSHRWIPKQPGLPEPKVCPKCKSYQWNSPRMRPPKADPLPQRPSPGPQGCSDWADTDDRRALTRRYSSAILP